MLSENTPVQPPSDQTSLPTTLPQTPQKRPLFLLGILLTFLILVAGGWYLFSQKSRISQVSEVDTQIQKSSEPEATISDPIYIVDGSTQAIRLYLEAVFNKNLLPGDGVPDPIILANRDDAYLTAWKAENVNFSVNYFTHPQRINNKVASSLIVVAVKTNLSKALEPTSAVAELNKYFISPEDKLIPEAWKKYQSKDSKQPIAWETVWDNPEGSKESRMIYVYPKSASESGQVHFIEACRIFPNTPQYQVNSCVEPSLRQ